MSERAELNAEWRQEMREVHLEKEALEIFRERYGMKETWHRDELTFDECDLSGDSDD